MVLLAGMYWEQPRVLHPTSSYFEAHIYAYLLLDLEPSFLLFLLLFFANSPNFIKAILGKPNQWWEENTIMK